MFPRKRKGIVQRNNLSFMSWNIQGVKQKCRDTDFLNLINSYDFVALQETWLNSFDVFSLTDFCCFRSDRTKSKYAKRNSGGVLRKECLKLQRICPIPSGIN